MENSVPEISVIFRKAGDAVPLTIQRVGARVALEAQAAAVDNVQARLATRTGTLKRSIRGTTSITGDGVEIHLRAGGEGKDLRYAALQEWGGVVRPKKSKFLAIPVGPAKTAAGDSRHASPRDVPGLVFVQSLKGQPMLVKANDEANKRGKLKVSAGTVYFILRKSVTIRGQHYLTDALNQVAATVPDLLDQEFAKLVG